MDDITMRGSLIVMRMFWSRLTTSGSPAPANSAAAIRPSDIFAAPIEAMLKTKGGDLLLEDKRD